MEHSSLCYCMVPLNSDESDASKRKFDVGLMLLERMLLLLFCVTVSLKNFYVPFAGYSVHTY